MNGFTWDNWNKNKPKCVWQKTLNNEQLNIATQTYHKTFSTESISTPYECIDSYHITLLGFPFYSKSDSRISEWSSGSSALQGCRCFLWCLSGLASEDHLYSSPHPIPPFVRITPSHDLLLAIILGSRLWHLTLVPALALGSSSSPWFQL